MSHEHKLPNIEHLKARAGMLKKSREYFDEKNVLEVDCSILNSTANIDDFIDPIEVQYAADQQGYLHTSPELLMKKLLAQKIGDIFYLGHVFRDHEKGANHHVEFTMVEWYREGIQYKNFIQEVIEYISLFISFKEVKTFSYHELLFQETGIDCFEVSLESLQKYILQNLPYEGNIEKESHSDLIIYIFSEKVETILSQYELVVLKDYPHDQAALAKVVEVDGKKVSKRFEIYYRGVELANGYDELVGDHELDRRYRELNEKRVSLSKKPLPIDRDFILANAKLPECCGVAVGFDRLMMLHLDESSIHSSMVLS